MKSVIDGIVANGKHIDYTVVERRDKITIEDTYEYDNLRILIVWFFDKDTYNQIIGNGGELDDLPYDSETADCYCIGHVNE